MVSNRMLTVIAPIPKPGAGKGERPRKAHVYALSVFMPYIQLFRRALLERDVASKVDCPTFLSHLRLTEIFGHLRHGQVI